MPTLEASLLRELRKGGFLVEDDVDEFQILQVRWRSLQYDRSILSLTIAPTLACNLSCSYCFEASQSISMKEHTECAIASFVESYLQGGSQTLAVTWYGGEPLLALASVERLSRRFETLVERFRVGYRATMVTNGTLLTREVADRLLALRIGTIQVTLDGPPTVHDRRRPFSKGAGSYETIVQNLKNLKEGLWVTIRINVDRTNFAEALSFAESLRQEPWFDAQRMHLYLGHVRVQTTSCRCPEEVVLEAAEVDRQAFEILRRAVASGTQEPRYPSLGSGCTATHVQSFVVGPSGELYRCWNHVGDSSRVVGSVFEPLEPKPLYLRYLLEGFEQDVECRSCRYLPLCLGGCPDLRLKARERGRTEKGCAEWKHPLEASFPLFFLSNIAWVHPLPIEAEGSPEKGHV